MQWFSAHKHREDFINPRYWRIIVDGEVGNNQGFMEHQRAWVSLLTRWRFDKWPWSNEWCLQCCGVEEKRSFPTHTHFCGYFLLRAYMGLGEMACWGKVFSVEAWRPRFKFPANMDISACGSSVLWGGRELGFATQWETLSQGNKAETDRYCSPLACLHIYAQLHMCICSTHAEHTHTHTHSKRVRENV